MVTRADHVRDLTATDRVGLMIASVALVISSCVVVLSPTNHCAVRLIYAVSVWVWIRITVRLAAGLHRSARNSTGTAP